MAIAREAFWLLCSTLSSNGQNYRSILQLGEQGGILTKRELQRVRVEFGMAPVSFDDRDPSDPYINHPTSQEIFRSLGFREVASLDVNGYEACDVVHDLNVPLPLVERRYSVIFDGGTSEHVFNQPQLLQTLHELCEVGGLIIHYTPVNNHVDHGFYQFSPAFHYEYYRANGYKIVNSYLVGSSRSFRRRRRLYSYAPLKFDSRSFGGWGSQMLGSWIAVRKLDGSTAGVMPQQSRYEELFWEPKTPDDGIAASARTRSSVDFVKARLKAHPRVYRSTRRVVLNARYQRRKLMTLLPERPCRRV